MKRFLFLGTAVSSLAAMAWWLALYAGGAAVAAPPLQRLGAAPLFHTEADHPANRLHQHLFSRTHQDGTVYTLEELEPPFRPSSRFLIEGASHQQALTLLNDFLKLDADRQLKDPLQRAILQRDLWSVFGTTSGGTLPRFRIQGDRLVRTPGFDDAGDMELERRSERRELQRRLVQASKRIALSPREIEALPDNLADAIKAGSFARSYDAKQPERPFLPPDLLDADGPWVPVSNGDLAAPGHVMFTKGRAVFTVLLRLPQGRKATEAYLSEFRDGKLPDVPQGTHVALLRQTLLIDKDGAVRPTHLIESLEMRVYQDLEQPQVYQFSMRRRDLFAGKTGGLRSATEDETAYFAFGGVKLDVFEMNKPPQPEKALNCMACHTGVAGGGIHGFGILRATDAPVLQPTKIADQTRRTIDWTARSYSWGLLQGMWEK